MKSIIAEIDAEITGLQTARAVLAQAVIASATVVPSSRPGKRRRLSKEALERIAAAQRKRWAAVKKAAKPAPVKKAAKKTPAKKATAAKKAVEKAPAAKAKNAAPKKATAAPTEAAQS